MFCIIEFGVPWNKWNTFHHELFYAYFLYWFIMYCVMNFMFAYLKPFSCMMHLLINDPLITGQTRTHHLHGPSFFRTFSKITISRWMNVHKDYFRPAVYSEKVLLGTNSPCSLIAWSAPCNERADCSLIFRRSGVKWWCTTAWKRGYIVHESDYLP